MTQTKGDGNGRIDRLEEALAALSQAQTNLVQAQAALAQQQAILMQNQAALTQNQIAFIARMAETNRLNAERFARIEAILLEHSRILRALPDAVRDKIGLKVLRRKLRSEHSLSLTILSARLYSSISPSK